MPADQVPARATGRLDPPSLGAFRPLLGDPPMNRHPPRRSRVDMRPVLLVGLALYLLVSVAVVMALGLAGGAPTGPLHAPPGFAL
jgi:nitrate reductase NapE component